MLLLRTPDKNCRKAEEQKQSADEASWLSWSASAETL